MTARRPHAELFAQMRKFISSMKYIGSKTKPPSQDGWIHTMNGIERLFKKLQLLKIKSLSTRRLNQDALENFFGCIRYNCGSNVTPTIEQFIAGVKMAIIANLRHTGQKKNCEDDSSILSNNLTCFLRSTATVAASDAAEMEGSEEIEMALADAVEAVAGGSWRRLKVKLMDMCVGSFSRN
ncbi:hypothetical protein JYU34_022527 [Plutella xylostella]|uniref:Transposable element P transposase-like RNase H C-terminal domain-containing protein n=1 Tax=Plutella xylostella TaxID=51655 RepID=A0ABQ7PPY6_PLUXY|nr:hypothetical protein JYU34_022527 [Plutella xylostella]